MKKGRLVLNFLWIVIIVLLQGCNSGTKQIANTEVDSSKVLLKIWYVNLYFTSPVSVACQDFEIYFDNILQIKELDESDLFNDFLNALNSLEELDFEECNANTRVKVVIMNEGDTIKRNVCIGSASTNYGGKCYKTSEKLRQILKEDMNLWNKP